MTNISRQFAEWVIALRQDKFRLAAFKLTFFYVLSTAIILLVSSVAILTIFSPADAKSIPEVEPKIQVVHDDWSAYELREHLDAVIVLVDLFILIFVSVLAYYFARRTLIPIKNMHELQQQFMGDVAHELRTPLAVIQTGADTILRKQRTVTEYEEFIVDAQEEVGRLTRLSNQLLTLLKNGNFDKKSYTSVSLSKLAEVEVKHFIPYAVENKVTIVSNIVPDIEINSDKDSLIEVIQNLLKNAVDYNKIDGTVKVSLSKKDSVVTLEIIDTGIGIASDRLDLIFNRFVKVDQARTQTNKSGTGLGLSIVKSLVTKLGGQISLSSQSNIGTTVTVTLPIVSS